MIDTTSLDRLVGQMKKYDGVLSRINEAINSGGGEVEGLYMTVKTRAGTTDIVLNDHKEEIVAQLREYFTGKIHNIGNNLSVDIK